MQKELLLKIDLLKEMSGSNNNPELLIEEKKEIAKEINKLKEEIENISNSSSTKYIDNNARLLDETIKNGLIGKIKKLRAKLKTKRQDIDALREKKENISHLMEIAEKKLESLDVFMQIYEEKVAISEQGTETYNRYKELLNDNKINYLDNKSKLEKLGKEAADISLELDNLYIEDQDINEKLANQEEILKLTEESLTDENSFIDENLKSLDDKKLQELNKKLKNLEKRNVEINTDPCMIAEDAKKLVIEDDLPSAILKVKELVTIIKSKPYMDIETSVDLETILNDAHVKIIRERDILANAIENKSYESFNAIVIENRITHLKGLLQKFEEKKEKYLQEVETLDTVDIRIIQDEMATAKAIIEKLAIDIKDYERIITEDENSTPKKKAALNAALNKKLEEQQIISDIIDSYESELTNLIHNSIEIINNEIDNVHHQIASINEEICNLNKSLLKQTSSKDILAIERDKNDLKQLSEHVVEIEHRLRFKQTPNEILDEIEMLYGSYANSILHEGKIERETEEPILQEEKINLNKYVLEQHEEEPVLIENEEPLLVEDPEKSFLHNEKIDNQQVDIDKQKVETEIKADPFKIKIPDATNVLSPEKEIIEEKKEVIPEPTRLKVINVEPIIPPTRQKEAEYIDFDTLTEGDLL